jgi:hypothetical protein
MNDDDALYHRLADCLDSVLAEATVARAGDEHSRTSPSPPASGADSPRSKART